jgi:hypothetical protein
VKHVEASDDVIPIEDNLTLIDEYLTTQMDGDGEIPSQETRKFQIDITVRAWPKHESSDAADRLNDETRLARCQLRFRRMEKMKDKFIIAALVQIPRCSPRIVKSRRRYSNLSSSCPLQISPRLQTHLNKSVILTCRIHKLLTTMSR